jgi:ArsR family transcriptional regulator
MLSATEQRKLKQYVDGVDVQQIATAFDALSEPNRCKIFRALLKKQPVSVGQLAAALEISESLASQHLKILQQADLVEKERQGKNVYYRVDRQDKLVGALQKAVEI